MRVGMSQDGEYVVEGRVMLVTFIPGSSPGMVSILLDMGEYPDNREEKYQLSYRELTIDGVPSDVAKFIGWSAAVGGDPGVYRQAFARLTIDPHSYVPVRKAEFMTVTPPPAELK